MRLRRAFTMMEMVIAISLTATFAVSAGTFATQFSQRMAIVAAKAAATEQANRLADMLARYAARSYIYWNAGPYGGESTMLIFSVPDSGSSPMGNATHPMFYQDPNGNSWLDWGSGRFVFYWSDASGVCGTSVDEMPMMGQLTSFSPLVVTPSRRDFVTSDGKSLFPTITNVTCNWNPSAGTYSISVTAVAKTKSGGTAKSSGAGPTETITVTRLVNRPR